jgi:broad specificity phosphatase PhoE
MLEKNDKERIDIFEIDSELQEFSMDLFEGEYCQNILKEQNQYL